MATKKILQIKIIERRPNYMHATSICVNQFLKISILIINYNNVAIDTERTNCLLARHYYSDKCCERDSELKEYEIHYNAQIFTF